MTDASSSDLPSLTSEDRWFVYLIVNPQGRSYVGATKGASPDRRLAEHNGKRPARATKGKGPWALAYVEVAADKIAALSREWHLKRDRKLRRHICMEFRQARVMPAGEIGAAGGTPEGPPQPGA